MQWGICVLSSNVLSDKQTDIKLEVIYFLHVMFRMQDKWSLPYYTNKKHMHKIEDPKGVAHEPYSWNF